MASLPHAPIVEFFDVLDQYSFNSDLTCNFRFKYEFCDSLENHHIAIFKLGWSNVTEYAAVTRIPFPNDAPNEDHYSVTFNKSDLPRNTLDLYQVCYLNDNDDLYGASTPFQFCSGDPDSTCVDSMSKYQSISEKDQEIQRLKEENSILRESLKTLLAHRSSEELGNFEKDVREVKDLVQGLKSMLLVHDKDINVLKKKIKQGGEEYRKLYLEKHKVQRKYDKLKSSLQDGQQPINEFNLDLGELTPLPPFPSLVKH